MIEAKQIGGFFVGNIKLALIKRDYYSLKDQILTEIETHAKTISTYKMRKCGISGKTIQQFRKDPSKIKIETLLTFLTTLEIISHQE